jgi:hypothetical protein
MVITLHYINDDWKMRSVTVAFVRILYAHTAVQLAQHFVDALQDLEPGLLQCVWAITADNATTNTAMLET